MIDVVLADNTRPACGGPRLIRYSAGGVLLALAKKGLDVRLVDLMSDVEGNFSAEPQENTADVCCYAVFFGNKVNAFRHMNDARRAVKSPRLIIAFGPFASVFPDEILSRGLADIVIAHDPEFVVPALLENDLTKSSWENVPNLSYLKDGKVIHTRKHSFHELDEIPFISPFLYAQGHRPGLIMTARGCQYHCVFCDRNVLWGGGVRNRSVNNVLSEIKELVEVHQARRIRFLDEDLAADHTRLIAICEGVRKIEGDFTWECSACVDSVNKKLLLLMAHSRCRDVYFGVESASPEVLRKIGKHYARQDIINTVNWAKEAGLGIEVMLTTGNPGETDADRAITLSALKEIGSSPGVTVRTNRLVILPGTAFYRQGLKEGRYTSQSYFDDEGLIFHNEKEQV